MVTFLLGFSLGMLTATSALWLHRRPRRRPTRWTRDAADHPLAAPPLGRPLPEPHVRP